MPSFNPFKRSQGTGIGLEISSPVLVSSPEARTRGATAAHQLLNATDELLAKARQQYDSVSCASAPLLPALNDRAPVSPRASSPRAAPSPPSASPTTVPSPSQISADRNHCQAYSTITPARRQRLESCGIAFDPVSPISPRLEFRDDATAVDRMRRFGSNSQKSVNEQSAKAERQFQRAEESHAHHHQPRHRSKSYYPNPETKSRSSLLASQAVINGVDTGKARPKPGALAPESPLRPRFVRRASSLDNLNRAAAHSAPTFLHDGMPAPSPSAVCQSLLVPALTQPAIPSKVNSPGPASPASSRSATPIRFAPYTSSSSVEQSVPACSKKAAAILGLACPVSPTSMTASSTPRSRTTSIRQASARTTVCPAPLIGQPALPPRATEMGVSPTALGMSMKIDGRQQQLDSFEASDRDLVITLRGGKAAVTGLEVMLVCIGEGEETVWELRVKRRNVDLGGSCDLPTPDNPGWPMPQRSGSAAPSSAGSYCNAPFTAIYTPPCEDLNMHRACYFSTPKPILPPRALTGTDAPYVSPARSPTSSRPQTSPTLSPTIRRHGTSGNTQLTALAERRSPAAPTSARSRFASPLPSPSYDENMRPSQSTPVTPRRTRFRLPSETVIGGDRNSIRSLNSNEDAGAGSTFSPAYRGLAQAYRAAYQAANSDGRKANEEAKTAVFASPESADQFPVSPASVFANSSPRSTCSLATRSPEHRYALYMSRSDKSTGSSSESSLPTSICSESVESLEIPGMFQRSKNYDSNLSRAESTNSPIASPALSSQGMATLLQRRLRNRAVDNSDESSPVSLHLTDLKPNNRKLEQDIRERFGSSTDDEDQQERRHVFEAAVIPAAAWLRLGEQRGSESSLSLKGRQGWSETEPENDDDGDGRSLLLNDSQAEEEQDRFSVLDGY